jgi:hypothetical protein
MSRHVWDDDQIAYQRQWDEAPASATLRERLARTFWMLRAHPLVAALCAGLALLLVVGAGLAAGGGGAAPGGSRSGASQGGAASGGGRTGHGDGQVPPGMPAHFAFGLMNAPGDVGLMNDMRTRNGAAWDFRYQYLAGGVNTGHGWETWTSPAGQFATAYMQESASSRYIPAFVYYELLQSTGACDSCDEAQRDLTHLATPDLMAAYYANWRLLMQKIGATGKPALVIVEPDLWAYMQQMVVYSSNSAAAVPASVANSGDSDAAGLPNTAQGFAWALLHMRDRYAPRAVLALHVSGWSTSSDIGSSTDPTLDVARVALTTAQFALTAGVQGNPTGISTWDLLSNDVADHDSGQGAPWWDRTNKVYPNFARYLAFLKYLTAATGRRVIMWQVPEGNQYFDTMNGIAHHTQDNRPEYILGHVADFARVGVVAVLFGPGNDGTTVDDAAHDGITNPAPINSFQCDHCNTHLSTYPDDDGGYLRLFVGAYYRAGPLSLANPNAWTPPPAPATGPTVTPVAQGTCEFAPSAAIGQVSGTPNPAAPGQSITITAYITLSCDTSVGVEYDIYNTPTNIGLILADKSEYFIAGQPRAISITGTLPAGTPPGSHPISVRITNTNFTAQYGVQDYAGYLQVTT